MPDYVSNPISLEPQLFPASPSVQSFILFFKRKRIREARIAAHLGKTIEDTAYRRGVKERDRGADNMVETAVMHATGRPKSGGQVGGRPKRNQRHKSQRKSQVPA